MSLYVKSNMPAWLMLWSNVSVEADLSDKCSLQLPVYWSCLNYFKRTIKFRCLTFTPEFRYWFGSTRKGWFVNAHAALAWYNVAWRGEHRWQDHNGTTPAFGCGIGAGYRFNFCKDRNWIMEVGIGGGVYRLDYDVWENKRYGMRVGRVKRTLLCVDQAFLTIGYRFNINKICPCR